VPSGLVDQVMSTEPYASAPSGLLVVDNGSSTGKSAIPTRTWPNSSSSRAGARELVNQVEIYFSVIQRKSSRPTIPDLEGRGATAAFERRYEQSAAPSSGSSRQRPGVLMKKLPTSWTTRQLPEVASIRDQITVQSTKPQALETTGLRRRGTSGRTSVTPLVTITFKGRMTRVDMIGVTTPSPSEGTWGPCTRHPGRIIQETLVDGVQVDDEQSFTGLHHGQSRRPSPVRPSRESVDSRAASRLPQRPRRCRTASTGLANRSAVQPIPMSSVA